MADHGPDDKIVTLPALRTFLSHIRYTLTVTCVTQDGVTVTGQTVTVRDGGPDGPVYATAAYSGQPVSIALPDGFAYHVSVSDTLAHHFNPTTAYGIIAGAGASATLTYSDFSNIRSAADIQAALDHDIDLSGLVGESITCSRGSKTLEWDVVDYDETEHEVTLLMHDCSLYTSNVQFEPPQALMWCESGLATGPYKFFDGTTPYYLTLTSAIPAGGQLRATTTEFYTYASQDAVTAIETGSVGTTEIAGATDLGTCGSGLINHMHRVIYSSSNYAESVMVNYLLNTDTARGTVVHGRTKLCRAWAMPFDGLLKDLDADFLSCIADTTWKCSCNNVYECPAELGGLTTKSGTYTVTAKFGLLSEMEVFGSYSGVLDGSSILDVFVGATADDRRRYRGTSAQSWWLRSPHWSIARNERIVSMSGSAVDSSAHNSYAAVPACKIRRGATVNLIDTDELIDAYVKKADGMTVSVDWYKCTDFISCSSHKTLYTKNTTPSSSNIRGVCFYDSSKAFLSSVQQEMDVTAGYTYAIPNNAAYIRLNVSPSMADDAKASFIH